MFSSHVRHNDGNRLSTKNGAHNITNVKNTTPSTLVAFCSSRMMRPWRDELRDMTLELREWCDRMVALRCSRHGDEGVPLMVLIWFRFGSLLFMMLLWLRSVADRRNGDDEVGALVGVRSSDVLWKFIREVNTTRKMTTICSIFWLRRTVVQALSATSTLSENSQFGRCKKWIR